MILLNIIFIVGFHFGADGMIWSNIISACVCGTFILWKIQAYKYISFRIPSKSNLRRSDSNFDDRSVF